MTGPNTKSKKKSEVAIEKMLKVWGKGPIKIADAEMYCYILEDGTPVLSKRQMMATIGRQWKAESRSESPNFVGAINLQDFIHEELKEKLKGIDFLDGSKPASGWHADILPLVCNVYLEARSAGALTASQLPIAEQCQKLLMAFARAGLTALIYEQLRYKPINPNAIRILVESYLAKQERQYMPEFPDEFYLQLDKIYGNTRSSTHNHPLYYAKLTRKYIYQPIERGYVLVELDKRNPRINKGRKKKHHTLLNEEKGIPVLRSLIWQVIGAMKLSTNKRRFEDNYAKLMGQSFQENWIEDAE